MEAGSLALSVAAQTGRGVANASVYLDGGYAGRTDPEGHFRADGLNPGEYMLRVEAPRYVRREGTVAVGPRAEEQVTWELEPEGSGELALKTNVPRAEVFVNGELKGRSDAAGTFHLRDVPAGSLTVEVRRRRYKPYAGEARVRPGEPTSLEVELEESRRRRPTYLIAGAVMLVFAALGAASLYVFGGDDAANVFAASLSDGARVRAAAERAAEGEARLKTGDLEGAEATFREAAGLAPLDPEHWRRLGDALLRQSKNDDALLAFYEAAELKPNEAEYWSDLGHAFLQKQQFRCAEYVYQKAIDLAPDRFEYHAKKGDVYLTWWKYQEAAAEYKAALKNWPMGDDEGRKDIMSKYEQARPVTGTYPHPQEPNLLKPSQCKPE
jgi:Flp pilus assembly protein TadD